MPHKSGPAAHHGGGQNGAEPSSEPAAGSLPVAVVSETKLQGPAHRELPSVRWQRRGRRVVWPIIGVSVLSSAAIGVMGFLREELMPFGIGSLFMMPILVSCLLAVMKPEEKQSRILGEIAFVYGVAIAAAAIFLREGALCLLMATPFLWSATAPLALLAQAGCRRFLKRADERHRALTGLILALLVPCGAATLDSILYADDDQVAVSEAAIIVMASQETVWNSLRELDVKFHAPPFGWAALLPVPTAIVGTGARIGARREVRFDNGSIVATVTSLQPPSQYEIALQVKDAGREFFDHWIDLRSSRFSIEALGKGRSRVAHTTTYRPLLFPRAVFGPLERAFGDEIQHRLLDTYAAQVLGGRTEMTLASR